MKLFNMLESVFFVTLGISCILLMMLIYHFKQRVTKLEQSSETMFEIMNNMVHELSGLKHTIALESYQPTGYPMMMHTADKIPVSLSDNESEADSLPDLVDNNLNVSMENRSDFTDSDDEDSDDSDSDDDGSDDSDDKDSDDSDKENDDGDKDSDDGDKENDSERVKLVAVDIENSIDNETYFDTNNDNSDGMNSVSVDEPEVLPVELDTDKIEEIHVNKLKESDDLEETSSLHTITSHSTEVYKKMNVPTLKSLVIEKGLSSDPSKMKKNDLITLLETNL